MKTRIKTAVILIAIFTPIFILGGYFLDIAMAIVFVIASYEVVRIFKNTWPKFTLWFIPALTAILVLMTILYPQYSFIGIFFLLMLLIILPIISPNVKVSDAAIVVMLQLIIVYAILGFNGLQRISNWGLLCVVIGACMTDIGAYFVGSFLGKHKLCERISPKKTVEGAIGGFITGSLSSFLAFYFIAKIGLVSSMIVGLVIGIVSQIGDLFFSTIKREYGIKDYGTILPGHGGMLDRIDSILLGLVCCYMLMTLKVLL